MLAFPDAEILDIAGPLDLLAAACLDPVTPQASTPPRPLVLSVDGGPVRCFPSGVQVHTEPLAALGRRAVDTLLVPGGTGVEAACARPELLRFIRRVGARARRVVSICTGAFLLAEAGLLRGRRATTHWAYAEALAARYPDVSLVPDAIFVEDGKLFTSAGITAGMDLALHLVEQDHGPARALELARYWLLFARRPGGQSQFSALLPPTASDGQRVAGVRAWVLDNLDGDLGVAALAAKAHMSPRHFARVFRAETGMTPARFVETARLEAARRHLEAGARSLARVARDCGFGDADQLRRGFVRRLGVNPNDYRQRFAAPAGQAD